MTTGLGELRPGFLLDILSFGGINNTPTGNITVNGTGTAYSNSFPLRRGGTFSWDIQFSSPGTIDVKVELEQGNSRPATEGQADSAWCVPDNKSTAMFAEITNNSIHNVAYAPNATGYGRLKFTGLNSNNAATACVLARQYMVKNQ